MSALAAVGSRAAAPRPPARLANVGQALHAALGEAPGALDCATIDPLALLGEADAAEVERRGAIVTVRSAQAGRRLVLRARSTRDVALDQAPEVAGETVATCALADWLDERGIDGAAFRHSAGRAVLGTTAARAALAPGTMADAAGLAAALATMFGIAALADRDAERLAPVLIERVWRQGVMPVAQAVAWRDAREPGRCHGLLLADDEPVLALHGVEFVPEAAVTALIDPARLLADGPVAAHARILDLVAEHAAPLLGADAATIPRGRPLGELGFDSLSAFQLHAAAARQVGVELRPGTVSYRSTLGDVAAALLGALDDDAKAPVLNAALARRLRAVGLDREYVRGRGSILVDADGCEVIDFVAQFGALPFGHNPDDIWDAVQSVRQAGAPVMTSFALPTAAARLADRLLQLAPPGLAHGFFCSSGAEAIEAAIKLCRTATGRSAVLSTHGAYHGLTLGALSVSGRTAYQAPFGELLPGFDKIGFGDVDALRAALASRPGHYAGFFLEPIQGEGGIVEPPPGYMAAAAELCRAAGVPFVVDEVQTGLGRCGTLFATDPGVRPDVVTLAKALGGGLVPIGAVLYRPELATDAFQLRHGSTFGNNALACAAAGATLDRLTAAGGALVAQVAARGATLKDDLAAIGQRFPRIVRDVRGRGYLLGVEFSTEPSDYGVSLAGLLCRSEAFGLLLASYLLHRWKIRVAPALGRGSVLRIEPALDIDPSFLPRLTRGMAALADALDRGDGRALFGHLLGADPRAPATSEPVPAAPAHPAAAPSRRFAFVVHLMDEDDLARLDPTLAGLPPGALADMRALVPDLLAPTPFGYIRISTPDGRQADGELIVVPHTAPELVALPAAESAALIEAAVSLATERGAGIVGLGGFTSVVTNGGRRLTGPAPITTGNALTALAAVRAIEAVLAAARPGAPLPSAMVLGGLGSIGTAVAKLLAPRVARLCVVTRAADDGAMRARITALRAELTARAWSERNAPGSVAERLLAGDLDNRAESAFVVTADPAPHWRNYDIVVAATSAVGPLVAADDLARNAIVCDLSRPINIPRTIVESRPDLVLIEGGVIRPAGAFESGVDLGLGRERMFACMAETVLLALEQAPQRGTVGPEIDIGGLAWLENAARRAGYMVSCGQELGGVPF